MKSKPYQLGTIVILLIFVMIFTACSSLNIKSDEGTFEFGDFNYKIVEYEGITGVSITGYRGKSQAVNIPAMIEDMPVLAIANKAFYYSEDHAQRRIRKPLTSVTIPEGVFFIGHGSFMENNLTEITIPSSNIVIMFTAFYKNQLTSVDIPEGVTHLGMSAFANNKLENIRLPSTIMSIGRNTFAMNQLTTVNIPEGVTTIGVGAFIFNRLLDVSIPSTVSVIGDAAFASNRLTIVAIPENITYMGYDAFSGNDMLKTPRMNVSNVESYSTVFKLGRDAFRDVDFSYAIECFTKALELKEGDVDALLMRANVYELNGEYNKAKADIEMLDTESLNKYQQDRLTFINNQIALNAKEHENKE